MATHREARRISARWWLSGDEECPHCGQLFVYEAGCYCAECDGQMCPHCLVRMSDQTVCPVCAAGASVAHEER